jgi:septal ring factor EnvC (AmiA/AmiB activator)
MKSCTGLWIVAPITRAVDDKTAKSLLGDSFKRQLKYDGTYSAVSFICSKTDDISITEAAESLGLEAEISESWDTAEDMRRTKRSLQSKIADLKEAKATLMEQLDECEVKTDQWEDLQSKLSSGKAVYTPSTNPKKRKRGGRPSGSRKNLDSSDTDDDGDASDSGLSDKENSQPQEDRQPLTEEMIEEQISLFRAQRKKIREERRVLDSQIAGLRKDIENIETERNNILADLKAVCIKGRNDYSRGAIKQDFAMGIKE